MTDWALAKFPVENSQRGDSGNLRNDDMYSRNEFRAWSLDMTVYKSVLWDVYSQLWLLKELDIKLRAIYQNLNF